MAICPIHMLRQILFHNFKCFEYMLIVFDALNFVHSLHIKSMFKNLNVFNKIWMFPKYFE